MGIASGTHIRKGKSSRSSMNSMERGEQVITTMSKRSHSSQSEKIKKKGGRKDMDHSVESCDS
jgi:hypothetical protein